MSVMWQCAHTRCPIWLACKCEKHRGALQVAAHCCGVYVLRAGHAHMQSASNGVSKNCHRHGAVYCAADGALHLACASGVHEDHPARGAAAHQLSHVPTWEEHLMRLLMTQPPGPAYQEGRPPFQSVRCYLLQVGQL